MTLLNCDSLRQKRHELEVEREGSLARPQEALVKRAVPAALLLFPLVVVSFTLSIVLMLECACTAK